MRMLVRAALIAAAAALLTGCTVNVDLGGATPVGTSAPPASDSPSPAPEPTESTGMAAFETIDGTWCPADGSTDCMTITLPDVSSGGAPATEIIGEVSESADATPCYSTYIAEKSTGMGEVGLFYCPKGVTPTAGVTTDHDNVGFDRLYLTQNPPYVDTWFRQDDLSAALQG